MTARWQVERPLIQSLREPVLAALDDPSEKVRLAAVLALANLDYDASAETSYALRPDTLAALLKAVAKEPNVDPIVRAEAARALGSFEMQPMRSRTACRMLLSSSRATS